MASTARACQILTVRDLLIGVSLGPCSRLVALFPRAPGQPGQRVGRVEFPCRRQGQRVRPRPVFKVALDPAKVLQVIARQGFFAGDDKDRTAQMQPLGLSPPRLKAAGPGVLDRPGSFRRGTSRPARSQPGDSEEDKENAANEGEEIEIENHWTVHKGNYRRIDTRWLSRPAGSRAAGNNQPALAFVTISQA